MPPIQASLRGSLLTGASALALSVSGYTGEALAQFQVPTGPTPPSPWTVWVEGGTFKTGGGGMSVPSLPGLTAPFMTVGPRGGAEGAFGFDYNWTGPWHFVFDFLYGKSKTATNSSSSQSHFSNTFPSFGKTFHSSGNSSNSQTAWEREHHFVADFMIGRDFGLGNTTAQFQVGIRIADLSATVNVSQAFNSNFFSTNGRGGSSQSTSEAATGTWKSRFFGVGPRLAVLGGIPIWGAWSVDYQAGIAGLVGNRTLDYNVVVIPGASSSGDFSKNAVIFNADTWGALSYAVTPHVKVSGGIRADYYANVLTTYNATSGAATTVDRLFWGPFLRLTGKF